MSCLGKTLKKKGVSAAVTAFAVIALMVITGSVLAYLYSEVSDRQQNDSISDSEMIVFSETCGAGGGSETERAMVISKPVGTGTDMGNLNTSTKIRNVTIDPAVRETDWNANFNFHTDQNITSELKTSVHVRVAITTDNPNGEFPQNNDTQVVVDRISGCWGIPTTTTVSP